MTDRFLIGERIDPEEELLSLFAYNNFRYKREAGSVRCVFSDAGCIWETVCRFTQRTVLIYGIYPFTVLDEDKMQEKISDINATLLQGCMFLYGNTVVMRTSADLFDSYSAYEAIGRALEYNAGAVVSFWQAISAGT